MIKVPIQHCDAVALIDDEDAAIVLLHRWYLHRNNVGTAYVSTKIGSRKNRRTVRMHQLILDPPSTYEIDHINGNGLDNRRINLRLARHRNNAQNTRIYKNNTSGYKGVHWKAETKRWGASITVDGRRIHLGYFSTKVAAAEAYDVAARKYFRQFAAPNSTRHLKAAISLDYKVADHRYKMQEYALLDNDIARLFLTQGKVAIIDSKDLPEILKHKWYAHRDSDGAYYVSTSVKHRTIRLHRFLIDVPPTFYVDHINGDGLDNRRVNLRAVPNVLNNHNRHSLNKNNTSGYTGIYWHRASRRWMVRIKFNYRVFDGYRYFSNRALAIVARDAILKRLATNIGI